MEKPAGMGFPQPSSLEPSKVLAEGALGASLRVSPFSVCEFTQSVG